MVTKQNTERLNKQTNAKISITKGMEYTADIGTLASSPGPFPAFQCCIKELGVGLGTRLVEQTSESKKRFPLLPCSKPDSAPYCSRDRVCTWALAGEIDFVRILEDAGRLAYVYLRCVAFISWAYQSLKGTFGQLD